MKIMCPVHKEDTPSMEVYPDGWAFCFGCGANMHVDKLGIAAPKGERYVEDIEAKIKYIRGLPSSPIRGLTLHADGNAYYIVWPDGDFYTARSRQPNSTSKYRLPSGHARRPLWARRTLEARTLMVVEGEINALSVAEVVDADVVCPGGAGDFYSKTADKNLPHYLKYGKIVLIADKDSAGAIACITLKANLVSLGATDVTILLLEQDANEVLVTHGKEKLQEIIYKEVEMPTRVQGDQGALPTSRGRTA